MRNPQRIGTAVLLALIAVTVIGLVQTGGSVRGPSVPDTTARGAPSSSPPVDLSPLVTARRMAPLAATEEERMLAQQALRVADEEVDLAFAEALRQAAEHPPAPTAETRGIQQRLENAQRLLQRDQAQVARLTSDVARATGDGKAALAVELELAKVQVELDRDEVDDAGQDLIRAGGDPQARIQRMVQEHEASEHGTAAPAQAPAPGGSPGPSGLLREVRLWWALHQEHRLLEDARHAAEAAVAKLSLEHQGLEGKIDAALAASPELERRTGGAGASGPASTPGDRGGDSAALVSSIRRLSSDKKALTAFDKKIGKQKELAGIYAGWNSLMAARQRATLHDALIGVLLILLVALIALFIDSRLETIVAKVALERRRVQQLHTVTRVVVRGAGAVLVLLVGFGPPGQLATFLGLAGAGLTVALKDFIVGFIGWFALMGRNGIRLGDWVEINGVSGEVVELGPFHTVLLETGNWAASGHPTGRRVTFVNSFAIEGHYFNFSTSGQWLWDEVHVPLPPGQDPYPIVEALSAIVAKATETNARLAEQEWERVAPSKELRGFSAAPAVTIRPTTLGLELVARYITRANERHLVRSRLYQAIVELIGRKSPAHPPPTLGAPQRATDVG
jgi:small-conductance mechanosensitive channel